MTATEKPKERVSAPAAEDLIRELLEYHQGLDPKDKYGFSTREIWDYRFQAFGYVQLFSDWYGSIGQHAAREDTSLLAPSVQDPDYSA